ncbi:MAG: SRPBCC family protein [Actinomycetota bacterium]
MATSTDTPNLLAADAAELSARRAATRLRNALRLNAAFSTVTGIAALVAGGPIAHLLGVDQVWAVRAVGAMLLGFAANVLVVASLRTSRLDRHSLVISIADLGWVASTVGVIALGSFSTSGVITAVAIALVVGELGITQLRARHRMRSALADTTADLEESPPVEIIELHRASDRSVDELWPVITDHALYARLALNLKGAEGLTPNGPGFRRTCTDTAGRTWSETCTLWEPGRRFDVNVDLEDYPYPLQLVQGSWSVEPAQRSTSEVGMRFAIRPDNGLRGLLFVPMMQALFGPILRRIARGWDRAAARR